MIHWLAHKLGLKTCPQCETLVDYALDGLEPGKEQQVREHLTRCPSCMEQVRDFWQVREGLGLCAPECDEPQDFNAKVLARLKEQEQDASAKPRVTGHPSPAPESAKHLGGWPRFWMTMGPVFAAMSVMMTAVAAIAIVGHKPAAVPAHDELAELSQELMNDPRAARVSLVADTQKPGCSGLLVFCPGRAQAFLKASNLSKCPMGRNYALWMKAQDGSSLRLARFSVESDGSSMHLLNLSQPMQAGQAMDFSVTQDSGPKAGEAWLKGSVRL
jgi:hypothetical protein